MHQAKNIVVEAALLEKDLLDSEMTWSVTQGYIVQKTVPSIQIFAEQKGAVCRRLNQSPYEAMSYASGIVQKMNGYILINQAKRDFFQQVAVEVMHEEKDFLHAVNDLVDRSSPTIGRKLYSAASKILQCLPQYTSTMFIYDSVVRAVLKMGSPRVSLRDSKDYQQQFYALLAQPYVKEADGQAVTVEHFLAQPSRANKLEKFWQQEHGKNGLLEGVDRSDWDAFIVRRVHDRALWLFGASQVKKRAS